MTAARAAACFGLPSHVVAKADINSSLRRTFSIDTPCATSYTYLHIS